MPKALIAGALLLSLIGDIALLPNIDRFRLGLGAFLAGHVLWIVVLVEIGASAKTTVLVSLVLFAGAAMLLRFRFDLGDGLMRPVAAYAGLLSIMTGTAMSTGEPTLAAGGLLFLASDTILGVRRFVLSPPATAARVLTHVTYHLAQAALVAGSLRGGSQAVATMSAMLS